MAVAPPRERELDDMRGRIESLRAHLAHASRTVAEAKHRAEQAHAELDRLVRRADAAHGISSR